MTNLTYWASMLKRFGLDFSTITLTVGVTLGWCGLYYLFGAFFHTWEEQEAWNKTTLTLALTAAMLLSAMLSPLVGSFIDRGRGPAVMGCGMLLGALAVCSLSMVTNTTVFIIMWMVIGVAQAAALYEPCFALVTRCRGAQAKRTIATITLGGGLASTIAFPLAALLADGVGWRAGMYVFAAMLGVIAAPCLYFGGRRLEQERRHQAGQHDQATAPGSSRSTSAKADRGIFTSAAFWILLIAFPLIALVEGIALTHIIPLLTDRGFSDGIAVAAASFFGPIQVLCRLILIPLLNSCGVFRLSILSFMVVALSPMILLLGQTNPLFAFAFTGLFAAGYGVTSILKPVLVNEVFGNTGIGVVMGFLAVPFMGALALSPLLGSMLVAYGGYSLALSVALTIGWFAVIILSLLKLVSWPQGKSNPAKGHEHPTVS